MDKAIREIRSFVEKNLTSRFAKNMSLDGPIIRGYFRVANRLIDGKLAKTFDIARIEVDEKHQGKGHFSSFLDKVEKIGKESGLSIYVESIMNPDLVKMLEARGYAIQGHDLAPNAIRVYPSLKGLELDSP